MTCEACQRLIEALGVGDVLPAEVAAHVATCARCNADLVEERHVRTALSGAPWPMSRLADDLRHLSAYAIAQEAERRLRHQRLTRRWAGGLGLLAILGVLGVRSVWSPGGGGGWPQLALLIGLGLAAWAWLEYVGRRMAAAGAAPFAQIGLGLGRAAIGLAVVVTLVEPSRWADLPYTLVRTAGGPAEAQGGVVEAELLCAASADGRLRIARASEGCRGNEVAVALDGRVGGVDGTASVDGLAIRFGTATIPAGQESVTVHFAPPMPDASYQVVFVPHLSDKPITSDPACHIVGLAGTSADHFGIGIRWCWFESVERPPDWAASDITVDWVAIGGR